MIALAALLLLAAAQDTSKRTMAVTFDDLPVVRFEHDVAAQESVTDDLLRAIVRHRIPAIGFVNEQKLAGSDGKPDRRRVALLRRWLDAGLDLGNHTWSHPSLHEIPLAAFEAEILRGEAVLRPLLAEYGKLPRFFRHPFLNTGRDLATRDSVTSFLSSHGYRVAPVTVDNADYVFAAAYDSLRAIGDSATAVRVRAAYVQYMESVVVFYENQAIAIAGRPIPQIFLAHASRLNADAFDAIASWLTTRGYAFIPLEQALADSVYSSPDRYTGASGMTWLHRWAITRDLPKSIFRGEPVVPDWVVRVSGF
jgi:peptidoglycan/xylan/chitin deacetylase (PgdA/CDA1 family)